MSPYQRLVALRDQCTWLLEHGADERGYIDHYGLFGRDENESKAIYRADWQELQRRMAAIR